MPEVDGMQVVKALRKESQIPIIMLTAKSTDMDKIKGLVAGADDYVTKPFNPLEIMARVKSLLRRTKMQVKANQPEILEVASLVINRDSHEVKTISGKEIQLTALEFGILYLLASHPNRVFSADEIFERVWHEKFYEANNTVMVHIRRLRGKMKDDTREEKIITTVWGVGYKIEAWFYQNIRRKNYFLPGRLRGAYGGRGAGGRVDGRERRTLSPGQRLPERPARAWRITAGGKDFFPGSGGGSYIFC